MYSREKGIRNECNIQNIDVLQNFSVIFCVMFSPGFLISQYITYVGLVLVLSFYCF